MLDQKKIQLMCRMAAYEKAEAKEELRIAGYFKKDYASLHTWFAVLWVTVGYLFVIALLVVCNVELLLENLALQKLLPLGILVIAGYLALLILYGIGTNIFYRVRYNKAKQHVKEYYKDLSRLSRMDMKEKKEV